MSLPSSLDHASPPEDSPARCPTPDTTRHWGAPETQLAFPQFPPAFILSQFATPKVLNLLSLLSRYIVFVKVPYESQILNTHRGLS